jgi:hypothetical protein
MPGASVPAENSAGWRRLWELIAARIVEQDARVQTAQETKEVDNHAENIRSDNR